MLKSLRFWFEKDWNESLYWKSRNYIQTHRSGKNIWCMILLMFVRRTEAKKNCTTGLSLSDDCCIIDSPLILHHGLNGIVIAPNVHIGKNVTIYQHVTISKDDKDRTTIIEDDVVLGAGAVILNNVRIGRGAKIGANAVVTKDIPGGGYCCRRACFLSC